MVVALAALQFLFQCCLFLPLRFKFNLVDALLFPVVQGGLLGAFRGAVEPPPIRQGVTKAAGSMRDAIHLASQRP